MKKITHSTSVDMLSVPLPIDTVNCPVRQVLDRVGDKWSTLVIILLGEKDVLRFNQLSHTIGDISQKMLTVTLRSLETDGLVSRTIYPEIPPRVEYQLTPMGKSLLPLIKEMVKWADQNFETIKKSRKKYETKPGLPAQTKPNLPPQRSHQLTRSRTTA